MRFPISEWRLAAMNIRGIDFNFGKQPACSFTNDLQLDLRSDRVMADPLSNMNASSSELPVGESP